MNPPRLELHVPTPFARPGEKVSFKHLEIGQAGIVRRPDIARA